MSVVKNGEVSSITQGRNLAINLRQSDRKIEAWRLLKRLIAISKHHHGPEHTTTKDLERRLLQCTTAHVAVRSYGLVRFGVLRRDEDNKYIVREYVFVGQVKLLNKERLQSRLMR
jgi:hypothetical protein